MNNFLSKPTTIKALLILQIIPLVLLPPSSFKITNQEWWLGVLLSIMALVGGIQIIRRNVDLWPWYLINFAQGFNIISRLLTLFPHAMTNVDGKDTFNTGYIVLTAISMVFSSFMIWYSERPNVRIGMLRE